tara:strand:- start:776 stop:1627 length:852 start_codon:yes stop_codon:yes gene_type:complete
MSYDIGIIGNGFVGAAIAFGFGGDTSTRIYDTDPARSTHSFDEVVNKSEFVFIAVPTPMTNVTGGEIDLSIVDSVFEKVNQANKRNDNIFIVKSSVIPGTVERYIERYPNLNIVFSPEFLTERNARLDFLNASRIVLGGEDNLVLRVEKLFRQRFPYANIIKTDVTSAQFIKYMANCFFSVKVSFINEMRQAADALGISWDDVLRGFITDGRIGNSHINAPGHDGDYGFGGKCFPKDINAFIALFEKLGIDPVVMKAAWVKNLEVRNNFDWAQIEGAVSKKEQ